MGRFFQAFRPVLGDFLSTIFFVALYAITGSIYIATGIGIAAGIGQIVYMGVRGRKVDAMHWMSMALVIVLGGATLITHDARFVTIKPSIATFAIGCVMLRPNWMGRYLPPAVANNVAPDFIVAWGYIWAGYLFALSGANLYVAFVLGTKDWAWFNSIVPLAGQALLFVLQFAATRVLVGRSIHAKIARGMTRDEAIACV